MQPSRVARCSRSASSSRPRSRSTWTCSRRTRQTSGWSTPSDRRRAWSTPPSSCSASSNRPIRSKRRPRLTRVASVSGWLAPRLRMRDARVARRSCSAACIRSRDPSDADCLRSLSSDIGSPTQLLLACTRFHRSSPHCDTDRAMLSVKTAEPGTPATVSRAPVVLKHVWSSNTDQQGRRDLAYPGALRPYMGVLERNGMHMHVRTGSNTILRMECVHTDIECRTGQS